MLKTETSDILRNHQLKSTPCRNDVLSYFVLESKALSLHNLEVKFPNHDRVTLYRTLNSFLESGILHRIPNESGSATYGLCHETCGPQDHNHDHIHFKCNGCGTLECLEGNHVPQLKVPTGYTVSAVNVIVDGMCQKCSA